VANKAFTTPFVVQEPVEIYPPTKMDGVIGIGIGDDGLYIYSTDGITYKCK